MTTLYDHLVVGSGCTGAMAAQTLVEGGSQVAMLDVGNQDAVYKDLIPNRDFVSIREAESDQHRYFLGDRFEGVPWGAMRVGAQLTPSRQHITRDVERWIPIVSDSFSPMQSLAYGGLGSGWGLACFVFSPPEIEALGLRAEDLADAYEVVSRRIGISAAHDDGAPYGLGHVQSIDPPLRMDDNIQAIHDRYGQVRRRLNARGFHVGQTPIAIISRDRDGRRAYAYHDMDFWSDDGRSAYRPWITIDRLKGMDGFQYFGGCVVLDFRETEDDVAVRVRRVDDGRDATFHARRLVLAAGTLGTGRIVLRSSGGHSGRLPLLCSPFTYIPAVHWRRLGKPLPRYKTSMSQLTIYHDARGDGSDVAIGCLYTYRSLLLHKLIKEAPLNMADGLAIMRALQSSFVIAGVFQPDQPGPEKFMELKPDPVAATGDRLDAVFRLSAEEQAATRARDKAYCHALRMLGCIPIKRINLGSGSSIHYAGSLPYDDAERPFTLARDGRLHGTRNVYVADGSGFRYLPGKGLTLSLMANAHRVARLLVGQAS